MQIQLFKQLSAAFIGIGLSLSVAIAEPQWHYPEFQEPIVDYLKSLTAEDVAVELVEIPLPELTEAEARKYYPTAYGKYAMLSVVARHLSTPAEAYLWQGGIWQPDAELIQAFLKDESHGLTTGQIVIPAHPNASNFLAWIYNLDEPWNPYYKNEAVGTRAAIISLVDLLCQPENSFYYGDERSTKPGRKYSKKGGNWGVHPGMMGFTLTFQGFTMLNVQDVLTQDARQAWHDGLKLITERFKISPNTGPGNMLLSGAIAFKYIHLATGDSFFAEMCEYWDQRVVRSEMLSPAGVYYDGFNRAPDASYEGIALHRIAELYAIDPSDEVREILEKSYRLKRYMTIVEPDGARISPSHFNDRCASGFATDQYGGREVMIAADIAEVAPFLRAVWRKDIDPIKVAQAMVKASTHIIESSPGPYAWGAVKGAHHRSFDWEAVLSLPYVQYYQDLDALNQVIEEGPSYPILESDHFTEDFGGEFHVVRRPSYAAWFYTGHANKSDTGATNSKGTVKGDGGYFNGFGGGGLSAFWVPEVGTGLIGRMNASEGYQRITKHRRFVPGWMDWANNHIVGELSSGKILTSARTSRPDYSVGTGQDGVERMLLKAEFVNSLRAQGEIMHAIGRYARAYAFKDTHIEADVSVKFWGDVLFKSLYETIPLYLPDGVEVQYLDAEGTILAAEVGERLRGVHYVVLQRANGGTVIAFQDEATIDLISESFISRQQGPPVRVQALQVLFPKGRYSSRESAGLSYSIVPFQGAWSLDLVPESAPRDATLLFTDAEVRPNLLPSPIDIEASAWDKRSQGDGKVPVVAGNVVTFDVSDGDHYSDRSKISQSIDLTPGKRYLFWMRAKSDSPVRLDMTCMTGINKSRQSRSFIVGPESYSEGWVEMTAEQADGFVQVQLVWGEDYAAKGLSTKATVTFDYFGLEEIDADIKLPQPSRH